MPLKNWSVTAASNNSASPNGAPENTTTMANVNDILRQVMADVRTLAAPDTIAAAATTDIGSKDATFLTLTGVAVTITALGTVSAGIYKVIIYNAAHTLTHNATSLILLSGANRTVVAGNASFMASEGAGNWRELFYGSAPAVASLPLAGGILTGLFTQAAGADINSAATIDLTAATGNSPRINGIIATSAVTMNTGQWALVVANAAWPLTYNATTNKLNTAAANYTLTAGDMVLYNKDLSGIVHGFIIKADGTALVGATTFSSTAENVAGTVSTKSVSPLGIREAFNSTGTAPVYACRAWVNFDASRNSSGGTDAALTNRFIRASGNVTSVLKNATGFYTITFTTALPDADYTAGYMCQSKDANNDGVSVNFDFTTAPTAAACKIAVYAASLGDVDVPIITVSFFR